MSKIILSDHARERMYLRNIPQSLVQSALNTPDDRKREDDGDTQFIKQVKRGGDSKKLHVVAKPLPDQGKDTWLIKTVWIRGEDDPNFIIKTIRMLMMRLFNRKPARH
ncbi:MAG: DUF4258 domain-containing protein [Aggregatilineales bacterium]